MLLGGSNVLSFVKEFVIENLTLMELNLSGNFLTTLELKQLDNIFLSSS